MEECLSETLVSPVRDGYKKSNAHPDLSAGLDLEAKRSPDCYYVDKSVIRNYKASFATFVDRAVATLQRVPAQHKSPSPSHDVRHEVYENDDIEDLYDNSRGFMSKSSSVSNLDQYPTNPMSIEHSSKNSKVVKVQTSRKTKNASQGSSGAPKISAPKKQIANPNKSTNCSDLRKQPSKHSIIPTSRAKSSRPLQSLSPSKPSPDAGFTKSFEHTEEKCYPSKAVTKECRRAREIFRKNSDNSLKSIKRSLVIIPKSNNAHFVKKKFLEQKYGLRQWGREAEEEKPSERATHRVSNYEKPLGLKVPTSPDSSASSRLQSAKLIKEPQCTVERPDNVLYNFNNSKAKKVRNSSLCVKPEHRPKSQYNHYNHKGTKIQSVGSTEEIPGTGISVRRGEKPSKREENFELNSENIFPEETTHSSSSSKPRLVSKLKTGAFLNRSSNSRKAVKKVISVPKLNVRERIAAFEKLQSQNAESPKKPDHFKKDCTPRIKGDSEDSASDAESKNSDPCLDIEINNVVSAIEAMEKNIEKTLIDLETHRTENKPLRSAKDELDEIKICSRICAKSKSIMKRTLVLKDPEEKSSDDPIVSNFPVTAKNKKKLPNLETLQRVAIDVLQNCAKKRAKDNARQAAVPTDISKRIWNSEGAVSKTEAGCVQDKSLIGTDSNDICYKETIGRFTIFTSTSNHQVCPDPKNPKRDQGKPKTATQLHQDLSTENLSRALERDTRGKKYSARSDYEHNSPKKVIKRKILPNLQTLLASRCAEMILKNNEIGKALYVNSLNELSPLITESPQFQFHCQDLASNLCKLIENEGLIFKSSEQEGRKSKKKPNKLLTATLTKNSSNTEKNSPKRSPKSQKPLKQDENQLNSLKAKPIANLQTFENPGSSFKAKKTVKKAQLDISTDPLKNKETPRTSDTKNLQVLTNSLKPSKSNCKETKTADTEKTKLDTISFDLHDSASNPKNIKSKKSDDFKHQLISKTPSHHLADSVQRDVVVHLKPPPEAPKIHNLLPSIKLNDAQLPIEDCIVKKKPSTSEGLIKPVLQGHKQTLVNQIHDVVRNSSSDSIEDKIEFHLQNYPSAQSIQTQWNTLSQRSPTMPKAISQTLEYPESESLDENYTDINESQSKEDFFSSNDIAYKTSSSTLYERTDAKMCGVSSGTLVIESNNHQNILFNLQSNDELNFIFDEQNDDTDDVSSDPPKDTDNEGNASDFTTDSDSNLTFSVKASFGCISSQPIKPASCSIKESKPAHLYSQYPLNTKQPCSTFPSTSNNNWYRANTLNNSNSQKEESSDSNVEYFFTPQSVNSLNAGISGSSQKTSAGTIFHDVSDQISNLTFDVPSKSEDSSKLNYTIPLISSPSTYSTTSSDRAQIGRVAKDCEFISENMAKDSLKYDTKYLESSSKNSDLLHKYRENSSTSTSYYELEVTNNSSESSSLNKKLPYKFWKSNKAIEQLQVICPNTSVLEPFRFVFSNSDIDRITQNYDSAPSENEDVQLNEAESTDDYEKFDIPAPPSWLSSPTTQDNLNKNFKSPKISNLKGSPSSTNPDQERLQQQQRHVMQTENPSNSEETYKVAKDKLCWSKERSCSDSSLDSGAFKINVQPSLSDFTVLKTLEIRRCSNDFVLTSLSHKKSAYLKTIQCLTNKICWTFALHYSQYKDATLLGKAVQTVLPSLTYRNVFKNLTVLKRDPSFRQIKMGENMRLSKMKNRLNHTVRKCLVNQTNLSRQQRDQIVQFLSEDLAQSLDNSSANTKCLFRLFNQHLMSLYKKISELDISLINFKQLQAQTLQDYEMWYQNFDKLNEKCDQLLNAEQINKFIAKYAKKVNYCFKFTESINLLEIYNTDREYPLFTFDPNQYKDIYHYLLSMYIKANMLQTFLEFEQIQPSLAVCLNQN